MPRRLRPLRIAATLVVFALLGAVVSVAVAWGSASWSDERVPTSTVLLNSSHGPGVICHYNMMHKSATSTWINSSVVHKDHRVSDELVMSGPYWSRVNAAQPALTEKEKADQFPVTHRRAIRTALENARGWPVRCLMSRYKYVPMNAGGPWIIDTGLDIGRVKSFGFPITLPIEIIWPGFAVNTVFYGGAFAFVWFAPGVIRRRVRTRRGQCPACGYPRHPRPTSSETNTCSECGAVLHSRVDA